MSNHLMTKSENGLSSSQSGSSSQYLFPSTIESSVYVSKSRTKSNVCKSLRTFKSFDGSFNASSSTENEDKYNE
uniref:Uncharacterized protein n=1 Tax=Strongyloides venezuelensis TaxID=75913 RepID=A0A0K0G258_STRVS